MSHRATPYEKTQDFFQMKRPLKPDSSQTLSGSAATTTTPIKEAPKKVKARQAGGETWIDPTLEEWDESKNFSRFL